MMFCSLCDREPCKAITFCNVLEVEVLVPDDSLDASKNGNHLYHTYWGPKMVFWVAVLELQFKSPGQMVVEAGAYLVRNTDSIRGNLSTLQQYHWQTIDPETIHYYPDWLEMGCRRKPLNDFSSWEKNRFDNIGECCNNSMPWDYTKCTRNSMRLIYHDVQGAAPIQMASAPGNWLLYFMAWAFM